MGLSLAFEMMISKLPPCTQRPATRRESSHALSCPCRFGCPVGPPCALVRSTCCGQKPASHRRSALAFRFPTVHIMIYTLYIHYTQFARAFHKCFLSLSKRIARKNSAIRFGHAQPNHIFFKLSHFKIIFTKEVSLFKDYLGFCARPQYFRLIDMHHTPRMKIIFNLVSTLLFILR